MHMGHSPVYAEQQQTTDESHYMVALTQGPGPESCVAQHGTAICPAVPSPYPTTGCGCSTALNFLSMRIQ